MSTLSMNRRDFLKTSGAVSATLVVGFNAAGVLAADASPDMGAGNLNPFVKIGEDGSVTAIIKHFEMGQGPTTGLTTLIAEEMDLPWEQINIEFAPSNGELYKNLAFGGQGTGGSTAIPNSFMQYRQAGAAARDMLIRAAAETWDVDPSKVTMEDGMLRAGNKSASLGEMVAAAAKLPANEAPVLKEPNQFRYIGKDGLPRKDSVIKTTGQATFAMDVKVPNMVYVTVLRAPNFGGKLKSFDTSKAQGSKGFIDAKALPNGAGVAVYGASTWAAIKARGMITAEWDNAAAETRGDSECLADHMALLDADPTYDATGKGNFAEVTTAATGANKTVEAEFIVPMLAHAPMEPLNCVIEPDGNGGVNLYDGCQFPVLSHPTVAAILDIPPEKVNVITVYAGGSFGRRATPISDYQSEAAMAFALMGKSKAVKLVWTREDDLAGGFYRPMFTHRVKIGIGDDGKIAAWSHQLAAKSIFKGTPLEGIGVKDGVDHFSVEGIADTPYSLNLAVGLSDFQTPIPVLWWRSVGHSQSGYVMESLMDMAAEAAGQDPLAFRLAHLDESDPNQARFAGVLKLAAEKAGWNGSKPGQGKGRGIAVHKSFNSYVAQIADVSVNQAGAISIDKVTCAVDCGIAVNPDVIRAQMEGGIGYGLGAVMRNEITLNAGVVQQGNFPQYEPLRIKDMPDVEVHIVDSNEAPTGVGEPGLPPAGPALANAIYAATGKRITNLPMVKNGVEFA